MMVEEIKRFLLGVLPSITASCCCGSALSLARNLVWRLHRRWFKFRPMQFDIADYAGMAIFKIGVLLPNVVSLLALIIIF
jgi:hypothetical protein